MNKNKFSSNFDKKNRKVRNVVVNNNNNNVKGFVPFQGERNVVGDSLREMSTDQNNPVSNQKSQNEIWM